jgi:hypothetical protein
VTPGPAPRRILLNYVYYSPVGHAVEALQLAKGLHAANPGSEVAVALSDATAWELTWGCPWIGATYRVPLRDPEPGRLSVPDMPREWDYIMDNNLLRVEFEQPGLLGRPDGQYPPMGWEEAAILGYLDRCAATLAARRGRGVLSPVIGLPEGLRYARSPLRLRVPAPSRALAARYTGSGQGPRICLLPAGSGPAAFYPDAASWTAIIAALRARFDGARLYLTGATRPGRHPDLTSTTGGGGLLDDILAASPQVTDCRDLGLWNQVALIEACDLLVSPHTGFAFLAPCVGTPWLAISGGNWPEYFYNEVPFYSSLPDSPGYPYVGGYDYDYAGPPLPEVRPGALRARIPDILDGAAFLLDPATTYAAAVDRFLVNLRRSRVRRDLIPLPPPASALWRGHVLTARPRHGRTRAASCPAAASSHAPAAGRTPGSRRGPALPSCSAGWTAAAASPRPRRPAR